MQGKAKTKKTNQLSLEEYLDFLHSHTRADLTVSSLNQIIQMHGFRKIRSLPKRALLDAVEAIELVDPSRSTLNENVSSRDVRLSLAEAIADVDELGWHECVITSVENFGKEDRPSAPDDGSKRQGRPEKKGDGAFGRKRRASSGSETSGGGSGAGENTLKRKPLKEANAGRSTSRSTVTAPGRISWTWESVVDSSAKDGGCSFGASNGAVASLLDSTIAYVHYIFSLKAYMTFCSS